MKKKPSPAPKKSVPPKKPPPPSKDSGNGLYLGGAALGVVLLLVVVWWVLGRRPKVAPGEHAPMPDNNQLGQYFISRLLADGGTASVYRATDPSGGVVAIKIPHADQLVDKNFVATFQREAEIGVELRHPSIVKVVEAGSYRRGSFPKIPYFVMEYLEGQDLSTVLREQGPIEPTRASQIARSVADALQWAHHRGVIHRDVTPRNIFITTKQLVKVMDFGISTVRSRTGRKAQQGVALNFGTPHYMAPERLSQSRPDERSDLYALGCIFFEMLTGKPPFHSKNQAEILKMHKKDPVPDFSATPEIKRIVLKLLEKDPKKRYQKAAEVTSDLADLVPIV